MTAWRQIRRLPRAIDGPSDDTLVSPEGPLMPWEEDAAGCRCRGASRQRRRRQREGYYDDGEGDSEVDDVAVSGRRSDAWTCAVQRQPGLLLAAPALSGSALTAAVVHGAWGLVVLVGLALAGTVVWMRGCGGAAHGKDTEDGGASKADEEQEEQEPDEDDSDGSEED